MSSARHAPCLVAGLCAGVAALGASGQSLTLSAPSGGYALAPTHPDLEPQNFTIEAWIRPTGPSIGGGNGTILSNAVPLGCSPYAAAWILWRQDNGSIGLIVGHGPGSGVSAVTAPVCPVGTTAHVAGVFDGVSARVYVNGVLRAQAAWPADWSIAYGGHPLRVGATEHCGSFFYRFVGSIDEVRLWNRALDPQEFAIVPCMGAATDPGLVAFWTFDGGFDDSSGHGHSLTPIGSATLGPALAAPIYQPGVISQPDDVRACRGAKAAFSVTPGGTEPVTYRWRHNAVPIALAGNPSAAEPVLRLDGVGVDDAGNYDCLVTNECGTVLSDAGVLLVCAADVNCDGVVNSTDVGEFVNAWFEDQVFGTLLSDWDDNGIVNSTDVGEFINSWFEDLSAGCG